MEQQINEIKLNGIDYVRKDSIAEPKPNGNRCVIIVDRGWIYAGDVEEKDGRIYLTRAIWVFGWREIGIDGVIRDPKSNKVTLKKIDALVDIPSDAEVYRIHVSENWGL